MFNSDEYKEAHSALHHLWTKYTHTKDYDKPEWIRLSNALDALAKEARDRLETNAICPFEND